MFDMGGDIVYNGGNKPPSPDGRKLPDTIKYFVDETPRFSSCLGLGGSRRAIPWSFVVHPSNRRTAMSKTTQGITVLRQSIGEKLEDAQTKLELYASIDLDAPRWFIDLLNDLIYGHGLMIGDVGAHPMGAVGWAHEVMELAGRIEENVREVEK